MVLGTSGPKLSKLGANHRQLPFVRCVQGRVPVVLPGTVRIGGTRLKKYPFGSPKNENPCSAGFLDCIRRIDLFCLVCLVCKCKV